jgi:hypothetical protein
VIAAKDHGVVLALPNEGQSAVLVRWLEKPKEEWVDVENLRRAASGP